MKGVTGVTERAVRVGLLGAWAALFVWLLVSGDVVRFIGPRTRWVIVTGAIVLVVLTLSHVVAWRRLGVGPSGPRDLRGVAALLVPIVLFVAVPRAGLGAAAAARKSSGGPPLLVPSASGDLSFPQIEYASLSDEYAATSGAVEGRAVELTGFVTHPDGLPAGWFALTRFSMFCCAADAIPYSVRVDPGTAAGSYAEDNWLEVRGALARDEGGLYVAADRITKIDEPDDPYL